MTTRVRVATGAIPSRDSEKIRSHAEAERFLARIEEAADEVRDMLRDGRGERNVRAPVTRIIRDACDLDGALAALFAHTEGRRRDDS